MSNYRPLACDLHDYLEIACLYRYWLRIELYDGEPFEAEAVTTETTASKEEFLVVQVEGASHRLRLDRLGNHAVQQGRAFRPGRTGITPAKGKKEAGHCPASFIHHIRSSGTL